MEKMLRGIEKNSKLWADLGTEPIFQREQKAQKIRIVIADDHDQIRVGLRLLLEASPELQVVGEASNGYEALKLVTELRPDILLLDMEMPVMTGTDVAERLKRSGAKVPILIISAYDDPQYVNGMLQQGVHGYIVKEDVPDLLLPAVKAIVREKPG